MTRQTQRALADERGDNRPLRFARAAATMRRMPVGDLLGLETAMRDVAHWYESAVVFTALRRRAEEELLPHLTELGAGLRGHLRAGALAADEVETAARQLHRLADEWRDALDAVRAGVSYRASVAAFDTNDQVRLRTLIPEVFAGVSPVTNMPARLYHPVSPASPERRRPFARPFLNPEECAAKLEQYRQGLAAEAAGLAWWEQDLRSIPLVDHVGALDSPIALTFDLQAAGITVFQGESDLAFRIYTSRLVAPFTVALASAANDEWWEAFEGSYPAFRDRLAEILAADGLEVQVVQVEQH